MTEVVCGYLHRGQRDTKRSHPDRRRYGGVEHQPYFSEIGREAFANSFTSYIDASGYRKMVRLR